MEVAKTISSIRVCGGGLDRASTERHCHTTFNRARRICNSSAYRKCVRNYGGRSEVLAQWVCIVNVNRTVRRAESVASQNRCNDIGAIVEVRK